jgi:predicted kinase
MLVVFRGLPGTGKSYLVGKLLERKPGFLVLSRDALRASIVPRPTFSADEKALVDDLIVAMAGILLGKGRDVLIDGMALSSASRIEQFASAAEAAGAALRLIECSCSESTALARITAGAGAHLAGDRGEKLYFDVKARFERLARPVLAVDTDDDTEANLEAIISYLGAY